jgi:hypothetical protein
MRPAEAGRKEVREMSEGESDKGAAAKARELTEAVKKLDLRDRVIFLGSAALVILFFLPWWSIEIVSTNGLVDACWIGFIAASLGAVAGLANMGFIPLTGEWKRLAGKTVVQLGLAAVACLLGPIYFWSKVGSQMTFGVGGKTLFFWLALLAAAGAAGAAGWKLADERKAAGGGTPPA